MIGPVKNYKPRSVSPLDCPQQDNTNTVSRVAQHALEDVPLPLSPLMSDPNATAESWDFLDPLNKDDIQNFLAWLARARDLSVQKLPLISTNLQEFASDLDEFRDIYIENVKRTNEHKARSSSSTTEASNDDDPQDFNTDDDPQAVAEYVKKHPSSDEECNLDKCQETMKIKRKKLENKYNYLFTQLCLDGEPLLIKLNGPNLINPLLGFELLKTQILNIVCNRVFYIGKMSRFIQKHLQVIASNFYEDYTNQANFQFEIVFNPHCKGDLPDETHHKGEIPFRVNFFLASINSTPSVFVFSVFIKPRDAVIDIAVLEVFKKLNLDKTLNPKLPVYKIITIDKYSIWAFIKGCAHEKTANLAIDKFKNDGKITIDQADELLKKLRVLDAACEKLTVSDLHLKNVIFTDLDTASPNIVPIDLESLQPEAKQTGLYNVSTASAQYEWSDYAIKVLQAFNPKNYPFRVVPLETKFFTNALNSPWDLKQIISDIQGFFNKKYNMERDKPFLKRLLLEDFLQGDVPYFTEYQDVLYWGKSDGVRLGKKMLS